MCFFCGWRRLPHLPPLIRCESADYRGLVFHLCDVCFEAYVYEGGFALLPVRGRLRAAPAAAPAAGQLLRAV